jgi:hypothetical protein
MWKRGKALGLLAAAAVAALMLTQASTAALADGRGHRGDDRHWDRGHHGGHHWKGHKQRHRDYRRGHHDRVIIVPSHRYYGPPRHYRHDRYYRAPSLGGIYLYFDLSALLDAPVGAPVRWRENDTAGTLVTTAERYDTAGRYCREYQRSVVVAGREQQAWGTACLQPDGDWQIVSERN